ncbi:MAG TPA: Asp-tRNA(Asn)/Glu-tRNA(Gln) amidotransferase subunit GatB [Candidatus Paceibacterota bacterium]
MNKTYFPTIGLEIHAELNTQTKMFCNSKNDTEEKRPNVNVCPICMGHPGTLPTVNYEAVKHVLKIGVAVGGTLAEYSEFDRKNYFYPDIPKGYQISQYQYPLVNGGALTGVELTRIHLEEDTAKSFHVEEGSTGYSLIDFNRAGVPLMELVTEPVITTADQAVAFAKELQLLLRTLGIAHANMEKGEMRVEANISVSPEKGKFGKKVEVKNLNSFRSVERAIAYELKRQEIVLEEGGEVVQETRGWDEDRGETFSQRRKEESHDYRYFPDPDIPKLKLLEVKEFSRSYLEKELPEMPWQKRERLSTHFGLKKEDVELYVSDISLGAFFEEVSAILADAKKIQIASNYILSDLLGLRRESGEEREALSTLKIKAFDFAELINMVMADKISSRGAKDILKLMYESGGAPMRIAEEKKLFQQSNEGELAESVKKIITENPKVVAEYRAGKEAALQFLVGQGMKATKGSANPRLLKDIIVKLLAKIE